MANRSRGGAAGTKGNTSLVYSTGSGRICPNCKRPANNCACRKSPRAAVSGPEDGIVRVRREVKGRGGKTVTTVVGVPLPSDALKDLARDLKRSCGTGGSLKDSVIEIQGDHRETLVSELQARGYTVKLSGG